MYTLSGVSHSGENTLGGSIFRRPNGASQSAAWSIFALPLTADLDAWIDSHKEQIIRETAA
jgi:hypothetical protein